MSKEQWRSVKKRRPYRALGRNIRTERDACGLTQAKAAERCGVTYGYWSQLELGYYCPSLPMLSRVAGALGVSVSHLLREVSL